MKYGKEGNALRILILLHGFNSTKEFSQKSKICESVLSKIFRMEIIDLRLNLLNQIARAFNVQKENVLIEIKKIIYIMEITKNGEMSTMWI